MDRAASVRFAATVLIVALLFVPVVVNRDSHPLSTYPVYAHTRSSSATLPTVYGIDEAGQRERLSMSVMAGTDDPLVARSRLDRGIESDADRLCAAIAGRVGDPDTRFVEIVRERHDVVARARRLVVGEADGGGAMLDRAVRWVSEPAPAQRLAVLRILVALVSVGYVVFRLPVFWRLRDADGADGVGVLWWLPAGLPSAVVTTLILTALIGGIASVVGARFRVTGPVFAGSLLVLTTYRSSFGQILWFENLMVLHLLVIAFAPAADALSFDARGRRSAGVAPRYGWPIRVLGLITVTTYVIAGVAKVRYGGPEWLDGDTLQNHVAYSAARLDLLGGSPSPLAGPLMDIGWIFGPAAAATVLLELGAPVVFVGTRVRNIWVVGIWLFHVGVAGLMFVVFHYPLLGVAFAPFFHVERLVQRLRPQTA